MKQGLGIVLIVAAFAVAGWLTYAQAAPAALVGWIIGLLGLGAVVLLFALRQQIIVSRPTPAPTTPPPAAPEHVVLKDGRDYRVDVDGEKFSLTNLRTGEVASIAWADITGVYIVAIDGFPTGDISYVVHQGARTLEVPLGAAGNEGFLATMQEKLDGFDNAALLEGMAMTHGFKQVWPAEPESAPPAPAGAPG